MGLAVVMRGDRCAQLIVLYIANPPDVKSCMSPGAVGQPANNIADPSPALDQYDITVFEFVTQAIEITQWELSGRPFPINPVNHYAHCLNFILKPMVLVWLLGTGSLMLCITAGLYLYNLTAGSRVQS
jgi:hypothetical protein